MGLDAHHPTRLVIAGVVTSELFPQPNRVPGIDGLGTGLLVVAVSEGAAAGCPGVARVGVEVAVRGEVSFAVPAAMSATTRSTTGAILSASVGSLSATTAAA